tara:strand:- start:757 stop:930 length:174 start_codon:yes stop_codon:yes gene_type:complete
MKKGKGYPEHVKDTSKSFGDPWKAGVYGGRAPRSEFNEWEDSSWKFPEPVKKTRQNK